MRWPWRKKKVHVYEIRGPHDLAALLERGFKVTERTRIEWMDDILFPSVMSDLWGEWVWT